MVFSLNCLLLSFFLPAYCEKQPGIALYRAFNKGIAHGPSRPLLRKVLARCFGLSFHLRKDRGSPDPCKTLVGTVMDQFRDLIKRSNLINDANM